MCLCTPHNHWAEPQVAKPTASSDVRSKNLPLVFSSASHGTSVVAVPDRVVPAEEDEEIEEGEIRESTMTTATTATSPQEHISTPACSPPRQKAVINDRFRRMWSAGASTSSDESDSEGRLAQSTSSAVRRAAKGKGERSFADCLAAVSEEHALRRLLRGQGPEASPEEAASIHAEAFLLFLGPSPAAACGRGAAPLRPQARPGSDVNELIAWEAAQRDYDFWMAQPVKRRVREDLPSVRQARAARSRPLGLLRRRGRRSPLLQRRLFCATSSRNSCACCCSR